MNSLEWIYKCTVNIYQDLNFEIVITCRLQMILMKFVSSFRGLLINDDKKTLQTRGLIVLLVCKAAGQPAESGQKHDIDIDNR